MRPLLLCLALLATACTSDPCDDTNACVGTVDAGPRPDATPDAGCGGACGVGTVCVGGACVPVDAGADGGWGDAASAACVPACGEGGRCEGGRCVWPEGSVNDPGYWRLGPDARAVFLQTCEPVGSSCA